MFMPQSCIQRATKGGGERVVLSVLTVQLPHPEANEDSEEAEDEAQPCDNGLPHRKDSEGVLLILDSRGFVNQELRVDLMAQAVVDGDLPLAGEVREKGETPILVGAPVLMLDLSPLWRSDSDLHITGGLTVVVSSRYDHGLLL